MKRLILALLLLTAATVASAQTIVADRFRFNAGPCTFSSGPGSPEGSKTGKVCDIYINTTDAVVWSKWSGTGMSGWKVGFNADATLTGSMSNPGYVSQLTGWRIDNLGGADFRYIYTDELHAKSFVADLEQALAGGQIITKSVAEVAQDFTVPAAAGTATLFVKDLPSAANMAVFESGDTVRLRTFSRASGSLTIADAYGVVTSYSDLSGGIQSWTFTRNSGGDAGGLSGGTVISAASLALDYGVSGNGYYEVNAIDGIYGINSPYSQVVTWTTSPVSANLKLQARFGNLRGVYGYGSSVYGAAFGDPSATNVTIDPTNGFRIRSGTTNKLLADTSGNLSIVGDLTIGTGGVIRSGATGFMTGTGWWMDYNSGTPRFRIGNPSGDYMSWDGSTLTIASAGGISAGGAANDINTHATTVSGGKITTGTVTATQIAANTITASQIAAGTITATEIASSTITAGKLNVSTLSAVSANLGTITAGSISGVSFTAGGGAVTIDGSGIYLTAGTGTANKIRWSDGSDIYTNGSTMTMEAGHDVVVAALSGDLYLDASGNVNVGGQFHVTNDVYMGSPSTTTSNDPPLVYSVGNGHTYEKTNGFDGTCSSPTTIVIQMGIVVSCS